MFKKRFSIIIIFLGLFIFSIGFYKINSIADKEIIFLIKKNPEKFGKIIKNNNIEKKKIKYLINQFKNRPWSALYVAIFYFTTISIGSLFFLSIQYASKSGWSVIIYRIMELISSFIPYGMICILIILIFNKLGFIHIFHWMNTSLLNCNSSNFDKIIYKKKFFFQIPFFFLRSIIYIVGYTFFLYYIKYLSKKLDYTKKIKYQKKLQKISIFFIIFFSITSMIMSWDWIMSLDPYWFSTIFGWYVLSTYLVTGITTITLVSIFFKKKGYLTKFNDNHLHDLSKYIFSSSLLWTYLWFSQFLLLWYGNIPEEIVYFLNRSEQYKNIHFWMLIPNFLIPLIGLMKSNFKRKKNIVQIIGLIILVGHYIDIYNMIFPSSVNGFYGFGLVEIGSILLTTGFFLFILIIEYKKINLYPRGNFFLKESEKYKYPF
jgi:hypothetical protein